MVFTYESKIRTKFWTRIDLIIFCERLWDGMIRPQWN